MITIRAKQKYHNEIPEGYADICAIAEWQYNKHEIDESPSYKDFYGDIGYWRKSWAFRNKVIEYLATKYSERDQYSYILDLDDLKQITFFVHNCIINPDENCSNLWTWREMVHHNTDILGNLLLLIHDIETGAISMDEVEIEWVDSY